MEENVKVKVFANGDEQIRQDENWSLDLELAALIGFW